MSLSRFFSLSELTHSDTAVRESIPNVPSTEQIENLRLLAAEVLDPLRAAVGQAIRVSSGFRGPELNRRIGGSGTSQHSQGRAADIQTAAMPVLELFKQVIRLGLPFDQLIYEAKNATTKWVHVSHDPARNRRAILVAEFGPDGRPLRYLPVSAEQALAMTERVSRSGRAQGLEYVEMGDEPFEEAPAAAPAPAEAPAAPARPPRAKKAPARQKGPAAKKAPKTQRPATGRPAAGRKPATGKSAAAKKPAAGKTAAAKKPSASKGSTAKRPSAPAATRTERTAAKGAAAKKAVQPARRNSTAGRATPATRRKPVRRGAKAARNR